VPGSPNIARKMTTSDSLAPRVSVIIPVHSEGGEIVKWLDLLFEAVEIPCEVLAVFDSVDDTTREPLARYASREPRLRPVLNTLGSGPSYAIRYGIQEAQAPVVVVTMGDGSDDPRQINHLTRLVERGVVIASASRYSRGGQMVGGPVLKRWLSRGAGLSLFYLAHVGTRDATNCFKGFSKQFLSDVGIESNAGFEIGIELVAKARRCRLPVAELPTIWLDRVHGTSKFRLRAWLPHYLRWYRFAFGRRLTQEQVRRRGYAARTTARGGS
jgi:dolichol-phosphate mannosyltransferase